MKKITLLVLCSFFMLAANAQYKFPALDKSPADFAYFPLGAANKGLPVKVKVSYSRPSKNGREIFGTLEKFGVVYRLGANESTEVHFFVPVTVGGKKIPAGTYTMFAIPEKDKWTIIINSVTDRWGAYSYDKTKDVVRVDVPVKTLEATVESLSMVFVPDGDNATLVIGWDKTAVELPIKF